MRRSAGALRTVVSQLSASGASAGLVEDDRVFLAFVLSSDGLLDEGETAANPWGLFHRASASLSLYLATL